jgi:hypothetical protein
MRAFFLSLFDGPRQQKKALACGQGLKIAECSGKNPSEGGLVQFRD